MRVYDALQFKGMPSDVLAKDAVRMEGIYEAGIWPDWWNGPGKGVADRLSPDRDTVLAAVRKTTAPYVFFNAESWPEDEWADGTSPLQATLDNAKNLVTWAHEARPDVKAGVYGPCGLPWIGNFDWPWSSAQPQKRAYNVFRMRHDRVNDPVLNRPVLLSTGYADVADFLVVSLQPDPTTLGEYTTGSAAVRKVLASNWVRYVAYTVNLYRTTGKEVCPFLSASDTLTPECVELNRQTIRVCNLMGVRPVLWSGPDQYADRPLFPKLIASV